MLTSKYGTSKRGITVPYDPKFQGGQRNSGFVDLRGRPELAAQIPEASESCSLKSLLVALAQPVATVFTLGCDLGKRQEGKRASIRYVAGGYVQVMAADFTQTSADDYLAMAEAISEQLDAKCGENHWELLHLYTPVDFRLGLHAGITPSLQIWFDAKAETQDSALLSREALIEALSGALTSQSVRPRLRT